MSGSGPGPSDPTPAYDNCLLLSKVVPLASPDATALATVKKNDILRVSANGMALDIVTPAGLTCGAVISGVNQFIECIKDGNEYVAVVNELDGAKCTLRLRIK